MKDFAIERISGGPQGYRSEVRDLAVGWPNTTGAQLVFVLVCAAHAIERVFGAGSDPKNEVQQHFSAVNPSGQRPLRPATDGQLCPNRA